MSATDASPATPQSILSFGARLRALGKTACADVLHAVLPSDCRVCGGPMLGFTPVRICQACRDRVQAIATSSSDQLCSRCGDALGMESSRFAGAWGVTECSACRFAPPPFTKAVAYGVYDAEMREMLHTLKFGGMRRVAEHVLGEWITAAVLQLDPVLVPHPVLVPVPLFNARQRQRGFNQADLLARAAYKRLRKARPGWVAAIAPEALRRVKDTRALYALRPDQRRNGLRGAFQVAEAALVSDRDVVLIDDILTTGATARECARVLLRAGCTRVWVATVARAQPESLQAVEVSTARWTFAPESHPAAAHTSARAGRSPGWAPQDS